MYAFIHIPKTGGSTLRHLLRCTYGARHCDIKVKKRKRQEQPWIEAKDLYRAARVYPNLKGICGHRLTWFKDLNQTPYNIRYFTFLREPKERFVSHFYHKMRGQEKPCFKADLIEFASDPKERNLQTRWLSGSEDPEAAIEAMENNIDFIGLNSAFDESIVMLKKFLELEELELGYASLNVRKKSKACPFSTDAEILGRIEEANQSDIRVYQYLCEKIYPKQKAAFGVTLNDEVNTLKARNKSFVRPNEQPLAKLKRNLIYKPMLW